MSAFGGKADVTIWACPLLRSLLGVKQTWALAPHTSAFDPKRTWDGGLSRWRFEPLRCSVVSLGVGNETARFHHLGGRYSGVAARGVRATAIATNWICSRWVCQSIGAPRDRVSSRLERNRLY